MAHFYGSIKGQSRKAATRTGSKKSGIDAHIRGWNIGCKVQLENLNGVDTIRVYRTGGSNGASNEVQPLLVLIQEYSK